MILIGTEVEIDNYEGQIAPNGYAKVTVRNSKISNFFSGEVKWIKFVDSTISGTFCLMAGGPFSTRRWKGIHVIEFENTIFGCQDLEMAGQRAIIRGNVDIEMTVDKVYWHRSTLSREFPIIVEDTDKKPLPDAQVSLIDQEGDRIWMGRTNEHGEALLTMKFTKENYAKMWNLQARTRNVTVSKEIGFLSSTPITLCFPSLEKFRKQIKSKLWEAQSKLKWPEELGKISGLDAARQLVREAEAEYNQGNFSHASQLAEQAVELVAIKIDGNSEDWKGIQPLAADPEGDAKTHETDIKGLYALMDKDYLYLMIDFHYPKPERKNYLVKFDMGKGERYQVDTIPSSIWDKSLGGEGEKLGGCELGINNVIEIKVPLEKLGYPEKIFIKGVHCWDKEKRTVCDALDGLWVVESPGETTISY